MDHNLEKLCLHGAMGGLLPHDDPDRLRFRYNNPPRKKKKKKNLSDIIIGFRAPIGM